MDIQKRMQQINIANRMIENKQEEIQRLHDLATRITVSVENEKVQTSRKNDRMADIICSATDLEEELKEEITDLIKLRREVMKDIDSLGNMDMIDIMYNRFVQKLEADRDGSSAGNYD